MNLQNSPDKKQSKKQELLKKVDEHFTLQVQITNIPRNIEILNKRKSFKEKEIKDLKSEKDICNKEIQDLEQNLKEQKNNLSNLLKTNSDGNLIKRYVEKSKREKTINELQRGIEDLKEKIESFKRNIKSLEERIKNSNEKYDNLKSEIERLEKKLEKLKEEFEKSKIGLFKISPEKEKLLNRQKEIESEINQAKKPNF